MRWQQAVAGGVGLLLAVALVAWPQPLHWSEPVPANRVHWIVIHHAATDVMVAQGRSRRWGRPMPVAARSADISRHEIDALHREQGWDEIGYHYVVRFDGTVEKGRAEDLRGAHARAWDERGISYNASSIGVCFAGNCDISGWTDAQQEHGYTLLVELMRRYNVPPERVIGHRECGMNTHCPGLLIDMESVRARLARLLDSAVLREQ